MDIYKVKADVFGLDNVLQKLEEELNEALEATRDVRAILALHPSKTIEKHTKGAVRHLIEELADVLITGLWSIRPFDYKMVDRVVRWKLRIASMVLIPEAIDDFLQKKKKSFCGFRK